MTTSEILAEVLLIGTDLAKVAGDWPSGTDEALAADAGKAAVDLRALAKTIGGGDVQAGLTKIGETIEFADDVDMNEATSSVACKLALRPQANGAIIQAIIKNLPTIMAQLPALIQAISAIVAMFG